MTEPGDGISPEEILAAGVVRVRGPEPDGRIGGGGFLIAEDLVLTCAHVICDALARPRGQEPPPGAEVVVDLPLHTGGHSTARVERWTPMRDDQTGDVAVLRLSGPVTGGRPLPLAETDRFWGHEVRVPGFPDRFPGGVWHAGRLRGATAQRWVQLSQADDSGVAVAAGFSGSPVWDERIRAVVGMVVTAQLGGARQSFLIPTGTLAAELPELAGVVSPASPFRGLAAFQEADRDVYFGREEEVEAVVAPLRAGHPLVGVVGPSGCGKSSLALAGVAPRMRRDGYEIVVVRAGGGACLRTALAAQLTGAAHPGLSGAARLAETGAVARSLADSGLAETFRLIRRTASARLLVVLDQAEELLSGPKGGIRDAARLLFPDQPPTDSLDQPPADSLDQPPADFPDRPPADVQVLITLRADFMDTALTDPWLGPPLARGALRTLTAMSRAQLQRAVVEPLRAAPGVTYDPGLVQRLLDDTGDEPGALPLLGFVLDALWRKRSAGRLRFAVYETDVGGVKGALGRHAEDVWRACVPEADAEEALGLLTALVRLQPGGEAPLRNVLTRAEAGEERWRLAQRFADRRLLVTGSDATGRQTVELAHEALIGAWPRLAERVRANRDFLAWRAGLRLDADRWREQGRPAERLLSGESLERAEERLRAHPRELSAEERQYIQAGALRRTERRRQERRRTWWKRWAVIALAVLTALASAASALYVARNRDLDAQLRAAASEQLAARAGQLDDVSVLTSALFASAAYHTADGPQARTALVQQYLRLGNVDKVVLADRGRVRDVALSADGARLLVRLDDGDTLDLRTDRDANGPVHRVVESSRVVALSPDGTRMVRSTGRGLISLGVRESPGGNAFRVTPLRTVDDVRRNARAATALAFDRAGRRVLAAVPHEGVRVWDTGSGRRTGRDLTAPGGWEVAQAWFGPDDRTVVGRIVRADATADRAAPGRVVRWDLTGGARTAGPSGTAEVGRTVVSADGRTLLACTPDGVLQVWSLTGTSRPVHRYGPGQVDALCPLYAPLLDDTGRYLVTPSGGWAPGWPGPGSWCSTWRPGAAASPNCPPQPRRTRHPPARTRCPRSRSPDRRTTSGWPSPPAARS